MFIFHQDRALFIFWHKSAPYTYFPSLTATGYTELRFPQCATKAWKISGTRYKDLKQESLIDISRSRHILSPCEFRSTWQNAWKINDSDVMSFHGATALVGYASSLLKFQNHTQLYTSHSVGILWTSSQLVAEISTWQHTTLTSYRFLCPQRDSNPQPQ